MITSLAVNPPPYVTSLDELFWGFILIGFSLSIHGVGMLGTLQICTAYRRCIKHSSSFFARISQLILASWLITLVHILEVIMWASFFQWKQCFVNFSTAAYFALNEYTTVGSALDLPQKWQLLEGTVATAGLLGFAWSTGALLTLVQGDRGLPGQINR